MKYCLFDENNIFIHISSGRCKSTDEWRHIQCTKDGFVLLLCVKGKVHGKQETKGHLLKAGDIMLLTPEKASKGVLHSTEETIFNWCQFSIKGNYTLVDQVEVDFDLFNMFFELIPIPICYTIDHSEEVEGIFIRLIRDIENKQFAVRIGNLLAESLLLEIAEQLIAKSKKQLMIENRFVEIVEWLRKNYNQNVTLFELAERFNYNASYLTRRFKEYVGVGPKQFVIKIRISKAKEILENTNLAIKEVAYQIGFVDEKHFMKLFKEKESISPKQYRLDQHFKKDCI